MSEVKTKKLEIEELTLSLIKPYKDNPRKNENAIAIVMKSISEFGFLVPIIVDKNNEIVAGHTRIEAAQRLGLKEVPTIRAENLSDAQIRAFRIMENKSQEYATWDFEILKKEITLLNNAGFDISLTGFEKDELDSEFKLNAVENVNKFGERHIVIMLNPPESPKLKERTEFRFKSIEDYKRVKDFFEEGGKLNTKRLIDLLK